MSDVETQDELPLEIVVELDVPLERGDSPITRITLRRATMLTARGLMLVQLAQMNVDEIRQLLPRISAEGLIVEEVDRIDPADMMQIAHDLGEFLTRRAEPIEMPASPDGRPMLIKVPLDVGIVRDTGILKFITLRRPGPGELRGVSLAALGSMSVDQILKLLPRITIERLTPEEAGLIDLADGLAIGGEIGDFLLPKRHRAA